MASIYGNNAAALQWTLERVSELVGRARETIAARTGEDPAEHFLARIKSEQSMREKCRRRSFPETTESALTLIKDAVGVRVVCHFLNDVYAVAEYIKNSPVLEVVEVKDYIRHAKPNGYRSLHLIVRVPYGGDAVSDYGAYYAEIQLRTSSQDTWASLEHEMRYKRELSADRDIIIAELKRCADELESTDLTLQTLRDLITGGGDNE